MVATFPKTSFIVPPNRFRNCFDQVSAIRLVSSRRFSVSAYGHLRVNAGLCEITRLKVMTVGLGTRSLHIESHQHVSIDGGLETHVDPQLLGRRAWQTAVVILQEEGAILPPPVDRCPLSIDQLIDPKFQPNQGRGIITDAMIKVWGFKP